VEFRTCVALQRCRDRSWLSRDWSEDHVALPLHRLSHRFKLEVD
jgi:hypothetical protein